MCITSDFFYEHPKVRMPVSRKLKQSVFLSLRNPKKIFVRAVRMSRSHSRTVVFLLPCIVRVPDLTNHLCIFFWQCQVDAYTDSYRNENLISDQGFSDRRFSDQNLSVERFQIKFFGSNVRTLKRRHSFQAS